ncbi:hypothetical protein INT45_012054 [Circinella minor]|uniref:Uncharacterized protein n=1 Tax=Circinella minor TaxID=1195481 RepID=A0A8H7SG98_9FUNG|nr:hypothetical protein INT45_012054 [Circinella minor]
MSFTGFEILPLTPEDDDLDNYSNNNNDDSKDYDTCNWIDDSECQENLFQIVPLMPEETTIDKDNHIHTHFKLFFEELGYLTEEPEPIDPTRDYDAEAKQMLEERDRTRQKHVNVSRIPSLSYSGVSSTSSSFHHQEHDVRSPLYMGHTGGLIDQHHHQNHYHPYQSHNHHHHTSHHQQPHHMSHLSPHHHHYPHTVSQPTPFSNSPMASSSPSSPPPQDKSCTSSTSSSDQSRNSNHSCKSNTTTTAPRLQHHLTHA